MARRYWDRRVELDTLAICILLAAMLGILAAPVVTVFFLMLCPIIGLVILSLFIGTGVFRYLRSKVRVLISRIGSQF